MRMVTVVVFLSVLSIKWLIFFSIFVAALHPLYSALIWLYKYWYLILDQAKLYKFSCHWMYSLLCDCAHVCSGSCVCRCICMCVCSCVGQRSTLGICEHLPRVLSQGFCLTDLSSLIWLGLLAVELQVSSCLHRPPPAPTSAPVLELQALSCLAFYVYGRDWTQDLMFAQRVFYHLSHLLSFHIWNVRKAWSFMLDSNPLMILDLTTWIDYSLLIFNIDYSLLIFNIEQSLHSGRVTL